MLEINSWDWFFLLKKPIVFQLVRAFDYKWRSKESWLPTVLNWTTIIALLWTRFAWTNMCFTAGHLLTTFTCAIVDVSLILLHKFNSKLGVQLPNKPPYWATRTYPMYKFHSMELCKYTSVAISWKNLLLTCSNSHSLLTCVFLHDIAFLTRISQSLIDHSIPIGSQ